MLLFPQKILFFYPRKLFLFSKNNFLIFPYTKFAPSKTNTFAIPKKISSIFGLLRNFRGCLIVIWNLKKRKGFHSKIHISIHSNFFGVQSYSRNINICLCVNIISFFNNSSKHYFIFIYFFWSILIIFEYVEMCWKLNRKVFFNFLVKVAEILWTRKGLRGEYLRDFY